MKRKKRILIANRGEIAVRIIRCCRDMGYTSVAIYSDPDKDAVHTRMADECVSLGGVSAADSYLNIPKVLEAARKMKAGYIHPGYGFLSENSQFAQAVEASDMVFIGPEPGTIAMTGDKLAARQAARNAGLPVLSGSDTAVDLLSPDSIPENLAFPVMVKAVSGGGGKGIRLALSAEELQGVIRAAKKEAEASFGDSAVYIEQLVQSARHIEVQILGDGRGGILCLGERECSIQRRRQKLIEEAPAPGLSDELRQKLYADAIRLGQSLNYRSLGTVEFLVDPDGGYYFIEVNPRIQVEHPVTEVVTRADLVGAQIQIAVSQKIPYRQEEMEMQGSAIEARILAEDASNGFMPASGRIDHVREPGGPGIRVDSALYPGLEVSPDYDSLLAKVIAWGEDRSQAIRRLERALLETQINGVPTDLNFLLEVIRSPQFRGGKTDTTFLDRFTEVPVKSDPDHEKELAIVAAWAAEMAKQTEESKSVSFEDHWRYNAWTNQMRGR